MPRGNRDVGLLAAWLVVVVAMVAAVCWFYALMVGL